MPSDVKSLIKQARNFIAINDHRKAIETCQKILEIEESYIAHVFLGASYVNLDDCQSALKHLQNAIRNDGSQALAYEGVCKLFEKFGKNLLSEKNFIKEVYEKMLMFYENDTKKTEATLLKFLKIFKSMGNQECLYSTINLLINNGEFLKEKDAKDEVYSEFLELVDKENLLCKQISEQVENVCVYVMESGDMGEEVVEKAWRIYFNIKMKNRDVVELWKLATEKCPLPCSAFNAEKALLIYMETYSDHKDTHMVHYEQVLPHDNLVLRLFQAFHYNEDDTKTAIETVNQVLDADKSLVVAYLLLSRLHLQLMNLEEAYESAQKGLDAMKEAWSVYHCSEQQMSNLFRIEQLKSGFLKLKDQKIEPTKLMSKNKVTFYKTILSVEQKQPYEQLEDEVYGLLDASMKEEGGGGGGGGGVNGDNADDDDYYLYASKGVFLTQKNQLEDAEACFDIATSNESITDHKIFLYKAIVYWNQLQAVVEGDDDNDGLRRRCIDCLNKAIKLGNRDALCYYYLGLYFIRVVNSPSKGKTCLMKAYDLDKKCNEDIMVSLVDCLIRLDEQDLTLAYLNDIVNKMGNKCSNWVHLRLGSHYLKVRDSLKAINHLQKAVRADLHNHHTWERLGEAYLQKGSYLSALKAFDKALTIHQSLYSLYQKALILQRLGELQASIDTFDKVVLISPDYIPALYGLSVTHLEMSRCYAGECLFRRALSSLQQAITHASRGCEVEGGYSCLWKCLSDSFSSLHNYPDPIKLQVPRFLQEEFELEASDKMSLLKFAERCCIRALELKDDCAVLWQDLCLVLLRQGRLMYKRCRGDANVKPTFKRCFQAGRKAVKLSPMDFNVWNLLGIVAASPVIADYAISQHCFIRSIQLQTHNEVAWSNLGVLYLLNGQLELAHEAFNRSQSIDPSFGNSWIGQALIAEKAQKTGRVDHYEAMDLYRHSVEICNHPEGILGFAYWVCRSMDDYELNCLRKDPINKKVMSGKKKEGGEWLDYSFKHLSPIVSASDALIKFIEMHPDNHIALNMHSLLNEKLSLHSTSCASSYRAMKLLREDSKDAYVVKTNHARHLMKNKEYKEAIELFTSLPELSSFYDECLLALSYYHSQQFDQCTQRYYGVKDRVGDGRLMEMINVVLGVSCYCLHDLPSAKEFLFENIGKDSIPSKETLMSLLCFSMLSKDYDLLKAVMTEVEMIHKGSFHSLLIPKYIDLAFNMDLAEFSLKKHQQNTDTPTSEFKLKYTSITHLLSTIHLFPNQSKTFTYLASFFLTGSSPDEDIRAGGDIVDRICWSAVSSNDMQHYQEAMKCYILSQLGTARPQRDDRRQAVKSDSRASGAVEGSEDGKGIDGGRKGGRFSSVFREAQKLVLLYPDKVENWMLLLACCQNEVGAGEESMMTLYDRCSQHLIETIEKEMMAANGKSYYRSMHQWLSRQRLRSMLLVGTDHVDVTSFLQNAQWLYEDDKVLTMVEKILSANDDAIKKMIDNKDFNNDKEYLNLIKVYMMLMLKRQGGLEGLAKQMKGIKLIGEGAAFVENFLQKIL